MGQLICKEPHKVKDRSNTQDFVGRNFKQLDLENSADAKTFRQMKWWENNPDYKPNAHLGERVDTEFLDYSWRCENPICKAIIENFLENMPFKGMSKIEEKRRHIEGIVIFLYLQSTRKIEWVGYWRKKAAYSVPKGKKGIKSRYESQSTYSYDYTITIVDYLLAHGLIEHAIGEWGRGRGTGNISRMKATSKLCHLFDGVDLGDIYPASESIVLRIISEDTDKKEVVEYVDNDFSVNARANLQLINEVLRHHKYGLYLHKNVPKNTIDFLNMKAPNLDLRETFLKRMFIDDFESGGRFYGGFWQRLPNRQIPFRSRIRIDGERATEIDYCNFHVAMAYNVFEKTATPSGDLYHVPGMSNDAGFRKFAKQTLLRTFNVKSRGELRNSIATSIMDGKFALPEEIWTVKSRKSYNEVDCHMIDNMGYLEFDETIDRVLACHPKLVKSMFGMIGRKLQFLDSQLAERILLIFAKQGKACLPLHDSFVVKQSDQALLEHTMKSEYEKMFGFPIEIEIEF